MRAVVTGAAGFAGYSLTTNLLNLGYDVYAVLRPGSQHNSRFNNLDMPGNLFCIELDCKEFDLIHEHIVEKCDIFYHLAWYGGRDDFDVQNQNIGFCLKAIESAGKLGCKRFVGIGSQAEYGVCHTSMSEDIMPKPINAYGAAKVAAMYLSKRRAEQLGIEWIWGRIFSLYGDFEPSGRMLPDLVEKLKNNERVNLSSCEQNWDYLHVRDAADAIVAIGERGHAGEIYNIANGDYRRLKDYVEEAKSAIMSSSEIIYGSKADPFIELLPDVSKIKEHTGWTPVISFSKGITSL